MKFRFGSRPSVRATAFCLGLLCSGCVTEDEVVRVRNPSAPIDAVVVERNAGAAASFQHVVYVVVADAPHSKAQAVASFYDARRHNATDGVSYGVNPRWSADTLFIELLSADNHNQLQDSMSVSGTVVRVLIRPGIDDPTAPLGSMSNR